jgi:hypothetical protein
MTYRQGKVFSDARRRGRIFNIGRVRKLNNPPLIHTLGRGEGVSTSTESMFAIPTRSYGRVAEEEEIQCRSSAYPQ